jgi:crotonobetainyl-CoA:carnitine CoA-transferase CaiB-like acyl-CoA transferase
MFPTMRHPTAGSHRITGSPVKLSETPGSPTSPAPRLGEHTRKTLRELCGLEDSTLDDLFARRVIFEPVG